MQRQIRELFILIVILIITTILSWVLNYSGLNISSNKLRLGIIILIAIIILIIVINLIKGNKKNKELRSREKLFNSLVKNSDTIYLMYDNINHKVIYITNRKDNIDNDFYDEKISIASYTFRNFLPFEIYFTSKGSKWKNHF